MYLHLHVVASREEQIDSTLSRGPPLYFCSSSVHLMIAINRRHTLEYSPCLQRESQPTVQGCVPQPATSCLLFGPPALLSLIRSCKRARRRHLHCCHRRDFRGRGVSSPLDPPTPIKTGCVFAFKTTVSFLPSDGRCSRFAPRRTRTRACHAMPLPLIHI